MVPLPLPERQFMQACWLVPDLRAAIDTWTKTAGVGPFFLFENVAWDDPQYRGKPWDPFPVKAAIAQAGEMQIELIENSVDRPSMFTEVVPAGQAGFHHMAIVSQNYDDDLAFYAREGADVVFHGIMMGSRVCWVDTTAKLGFMVEVIDGKNNKGVEIVFPQFRAAAENWDGKDPIRYLA